MAIKNKIPFVEFYDKGKPIIDDVNILDVFQKYTSVDVSRASRGNVNCPRPTHQDKKPSTKIYHETNTCFCFGCQQSWNSLSLYAEMTNRSLDGKEYFQTLKDFADDFGLDWRSSRYSNFQEVEKIKKEVYGNSFEPQFSDRLVLAGSDIKFLGLYEDRENGIILSKEWEKNKTEVEEFLFTMIESKFQELSSNLADVLDNIVEYEKKFNSKEEKAIKEQYSAGVKNLRENPNYWINTTQLHERVENKVKNDIAESFKIQPEEIIPRINGYNNYIKQFDIAKNTANDVLKCYNLAKNLIEQCMERENYCNIKHETYEGLDIKNLTEMSSAILYNSQEKHFQRFDFSKIFNFKNLGFEEIIKKCQEQQEKIQEKQEEIQEEDKWEKEDV